MSEGMSAERIAELGASSPTRDEMHEALAEVERLRAHLAVEHLATEAAEIENDQLRARIDEIGETREEYAVRNDGHEAFCATPQGALRIAKEWTAAKPGSPWQANRRLVGEWREVPDA